MKDDRSKELPSQTVVCGHLWYDGTWQRGHVGLRDGKVGFVGVGEPEPGISARDFGTALILPGIVDAHVHSYSNPREGLRATTSAAAAGGVTTIVEMPFDAPEPVSTLRRYSEKQQIIAEQAMIDVALLGTVTPGGGWREVANLVSAGVVGFKASLFDTDPIRFPRINDAELVPLMGEIGQAGSTLCVHAENNEIIKALLANEDNQLSEDPGVHARTRPPVAETLAVLTAMEIAADQGNALHLCHLSLGRSSELVRWYQGQGVDITFETCPHYLKFTDDDVTAQGGRLKINPPIRPPAEREAMWQALVSGTASVVASDHAPWNLVDKTKNQMLANHSGAPGTETLVPVTIGECVRRYGIGPELHHVAAAMTAGPARRYGLSAKGRLEAGADGDLAIVKITEDWQIAAEQLHSNAGWSPFDKLRPGAQVLATYSRGEQVWSVADGLTAVAGRGQQLRRG